MTEFARGLDVSKHQLFTLIDWRRARVEHGITFAIARATYGVTPDRMARDHAKGIRAAGDTFGLYHFFRPDLDLKAQLNAFDSVVRTCKLGAGDLFPAVDVERYPDQWRNRKPVRWAPPSPAWCSALADLIGALRSIYGGAIVYVSKEDWKLLGSPTWLLENHLWVPHWPAKGATSPLPAPSVPGDARWSIWQQMVGPLGKSLQDPDSPGVVDQDVARLPLPTIGSPTVDDRFTPMELLELNRDSAAKERQ